MATSMKLKLTLQARLKKEDFMHAIKRRGGNWRVFEAFFRG